MSVNREKTSQLVRMVDIFIQLEHNENCLDEEMAADYLSRACSTLPVLFEEDEIEEARREIAAKYQVKTTPGSSILADYDQDNWYDEWKSDPDHDSKFWTRYRNYLIDVKHFSPNVVSTLGDDTLDQKLMNYILNPSANYGQPVLKRGLIIGDVQSGKTSTYIGLMCKAADAGYKVFILLTGTIESLRKQTQERVEEGFIGIDMSSNTTGGNRVGVGLDNQSIFAMSMTSRVKDFTGDNDKIAVSLGGNNQAVVFVIKKNTTTLQKLTKWLVTLNADPVTKKIDFPMLMIDDEADNASINTSANKEDPTKINKLIRQLASVFTKSNYVGFTATPFANVFIDPVDTEKMETQDLFPEDFIVALPTPTNYIGADQIFDPKGKYHSQLTYITDAGQEEADGYPFYFKHTKEWTGELPDSLTDAIYAFYIANAIRDLRGDISEHRSMLINISRFVAVQHYIKKVVEGIHKAAYRSIKFNLDTTEVCLKDPVLARLYSIWNGYYSFTEFSWEQITETIFKSIENIQIKVVNSSNKTEKLEYPKNDSLRVIAIGGLALSRGLTLEGLVISYFYRNTSTYDVLMQMGRWFGYRNNYDDLFRIWTHKASADWYAEIADATERLKLDMVTMHELRQKPRDFGIRVRNDSADLQITAYNKMRNATDEVEFTSYFGGIIETPYLFFNEEAHFNNFREVESLVKEWISEGHVFERQADSLNKGRYIITDIPKERVISFLRKLKISRFSSSFDVRQISDFLANCVDPSIDKFDIAFMDGSSQEGAVLQSFAGKSIYRVRRTCSIDRDTDRLNIGRRGKLGGPNDGLAGIVTFNGRKASDIVEDAKHAFRTYYKNKNHTEFDTSRNYPSDTWFRYIKDRKPLLMVYFIEIDYDKEQPQQKVQIEELKGKLGSCPITGFMLGLPWNDNASKKYTQYKANKVYNWFEKDDLDVGEEE